MDHKFNVSKLTTLLERLKLQIDIEHMQIMILGTISIALL